MGANGIDPGLLRQFINIDIIPRAAWKQQITSLNSYWGKFFILSLVVPKKFIWLRDEGRLVGQVR